VLLGRSCSKHLSAPRAETRPTGRRSHVLQPSHARRRHSCRVGGPVPAPGVSVSDDPANATNTCGALPGGRSVSAPQDATSGDVAYRGPTFFYHHTQGNGITSVLKARSPHRACPCEIIKQTQRTRALWFRVAAACPHRKPPRRETRPTVPRVSVRPGIIADRS
jgi:hypothetical protein